MFNHLAGRKVLDLQTLWELSRDYDFSPYQMSCDEALEQLGLLWKCSSQQCLNENRGDPSYCYGPSQECQNCGSIRPEK